MNSSNSGVSLREAHFHQFDKKLDFNSAFEVIAENYLYTAGERRDILIELAKNRFVHLHGVSTNVGSLDELDVHHLKALAQVGSQIGARLFSDHLCWTRLDGKSTFELLPVPRTRKMIDHVGQRVQKIQDLFGNHFLLENISAYFSYQIDEMTELNFMSELYDRHQVKFVLDLNNLYVNSKNFAFDAAEFIQQLPKESVSAYHLGGHEDFGSFLFDTHGSEVIDPVKKLFWQAEKRFGEKPTFLERDENIPHDLSNLTSELMGLAVPSHG